MNFTLIPEFDVSSNGVVEWLDNCELVFWLQGFSNLLNICVAPFEVILSFSLFSYLVDGMMGN